MLKIGNNLEFEKYNNINTESGFIMDDDLSCSVYLNHLSLSLPCGCLQNQIEHTQQVQGVGGIVLICI